MSLPARFATQQLYAATELAPKDPSIFAEAAEMALNLHRSPDGPVIFLAQALGYLSHACRLEQKRCAPLGKLLQKFAQENRIGNLRGDDQRLITQEIQALRAMQTNKYAECCRANQKHGKKSCCLVEMISAPLPQVNDVLEATKDHCESQGRCPDPLVSLDYDNLDLQMVQTSLASFRSRSVWPTWVSVVNLNVPPSFHKRLSELAVARYHMFYKEVTATRSHATQLDVNNQFFNQQLKSEADAQNPRARRWWPELYEHSPEWRALFKYTREACIQHVLRNGRGQTREYLESLQLILWAAVYTTNTSHNTHMHEQSLCSGTYYSSTPPDSMPLILSDPRGGQPMHTDMAKQEAEPEAPFFHQVTFFPKEGDMLMFPSYLPHSVPMATPNSNPRVVWAYNLEGGVDSYARMSGIEM